MREVSHFVGLDVHKDTISIAVAEAGRAQARDLGSIPNELAKLRRKLDRLGARRLICCCYEAGPTGYGLYRHLIVEGYACSVVAPSKIPLKLGDRVKTDRRDALKLAHYLRSGDLTEVWVPDPQVEALRDLVRSREAAKADQRAARHRLSKFLLRLDRRYTTGKRAWTKKHLEWVRAQRFEYPAQDCAHREMLHAVEEITDRIVRLDMDIDREARASTLWPLIAALCALKGVRILTATALATELGDITRFENARQLMSYVGLVPSEHSSGRSTYRGGITKTGNGRLRRLLIECAWHYRLRPRRGEALQERSSNLSSGLRNISWQAQHRLHTRFRKLVGRGKKSQVAATAVARELLGFVWAVGQEVTLSAS